MNKKLLTVAVSAALVGAMGVAQADVKINGTINASLDSIKGKTSATATATDNKNKLNVMSNASNVVLSATTDLGGGMKGVFSWQEFVQADFNSGQDKNTGSLLGGNTYLGLAGDTWGMVALGTNDSGAKQNGANFDLFNNQIGDSRNADRANNRMTNLVFYTSPNVAGLSLLVGHSTNLGLSPIGNSGGSYGTSPDAGPTQDSSDTANTLLVKYSAGPLALGLGYDKLSLGTRVPGDGEKWLNLGAKYGLPSGTDLIAFYQKDSNVGNVSGTDYKTLGIGAAQQFGAETIKAQYYQLKATASGASTECKPKLFAIGWDHAFSKAYTGYVNYAQAKQDKNSSCNTAMSMTGGGHGNNLNNPGTVAGQTMSGISVGAIMKF